MTGSTWYRCGLWVLLASHVMALGHLCLIQGPPTWDGGDHSFHAFQIHQALQRTDLDLFLAVTRSQTLWPFLHSWITGACLTLTGSSFITIRFVSLGFGLITLALSGFFAHRHRVASAPLTAFLLAGSPLFILYSIQPMLEIFGAAFTIAALGCAITGITTPDLRTRMRILTTTLVLLTFFIKYVYGILLILTLGLHCLHTFLHPGGGSHGSRRDAVLNAATWIAAPLLTAALWLMHPSQRTGFLACLHNPDSGFSILNPINWLIYPVTILLFYVSSPFLAIVLGLAGWRAYRRNRSPLLEISGLYILTTVILL
ncbi:hypothetical protein JXA80_03315, partial [bacterium]|nr:hypothetical protein [candidate division CSSED10-310 bacterium]